MVSNNKNNTVKRKPSGLRRTQAASAASAGGSLEMSKRQRVQEEVVGVVEETLLTELEKAELIQSTLNTVHGLYTTYIVAQQQEEEELTDDHLQTSVMYSRGIIHEIDSMFKQLYPPSFSSTTTLTTTKLATQPSSLLSSSSTAKLDNNNNTADVKIPSMLYYLFGQALYHLGKFDSNQQNQHDDEAAIDRVKRPLKVQQPIDFFKAAAARFESALERTVEEEREGKKNIIHSVQQHDFNSNNIDNNDNNDENQEAPPAPLYIEGYRIKESLGRVLLEMAVIEATTHSRPPTQSLFLDRITSELFEPLMQVRPDKCIELCSLVYDYADICAGLSGEVLLTLSTGVSETVLRNEWVIRHLGTFINSVMEKENGGIDSSASSVALARMGMAASYLSNGCFYMDCYDSISCREESEEDSEIDEVLESDEKNGDKKEKVFLEAGDSCPLTKTVLLNKALMCLTEANALLETVKKSADASICLDDQQDSLIRLYCLVRKREEGGSYLVICVNSLLLPSLSLNSKLGETHVNLGALGELMTQEGIECEKSSSSTINEETYSRAISYFNQVKEIGGADALPEKFVDFISAFEGDDDDDE